MGYVDMECWCKELIISFLDIRPREILTKIIRSWSKICLVGRKSMCLSPAKLCHVTVQNQYVTLSTKPLINKGNIPN